MATKKKTRKPRARPRVKAKFSRHVAKHPAPIAATVGLLISGGEILFGPATSIGYGSLVDNLTNPAQPTLSKRLPYAMTGLKAQLMNPSNYYPAIGGVLISAIGPKVPLIGKPINRMVRDYSKGKARV